MDNLEIVTVNFNTPEFIFTLLSSFKKYNEWCNVKINVIDNSNFPILPAGETEDLNIEYFDKKLYKNLEKFSKMSKEKTLASAHHCFTIDWYIKNRAKSDYLLLLDSDIIFKRSFEKEFKEFIENDYALMGYERMNYACHCIAPWACFINVKKMKELNISYFDIDRILFIKNNKTHDTGASLFEDFKKNNLKIKTTEDNTFYIHLKGGSLNKEKRKEFIIKYKEIWQK